MATREPVWITGVGTANPLASSYAGTADQFLAGQSGVRAVTIFDASKHRCRVMAPVCDFGVPPKWDVDAFKRLPRAEQLFLWCATHALQEAGWWERRGDVRVGLVMGLGAEWIRTWEVSMYEGDGQRVHEPSRDQDSMVNIIQRRLGLTGLSAMVGAACASSNHALALARRWLQLGWVDICLAGSCNVDTTPMSLACFGNIGALTRRNDNPTAASRPFDKGRDGFVMGDGGAMFVLELAAAARRRGVTPWAEIAGFGSTSDAYHMVTPGVDPEPAVRAMRAALKEANLNPEEIDYINAHATSTPMGDRGEARVLQIVLGDAVRKVPVSSTKSMVGHLLSASAAVEAVACLVALDRQALPPTINLDDPDPECDLCHIPHQARPQPAQVVVSNSFGFGGCNTSLILRKVA